MNIAISSIGLATAQGSAAHIAAGQPLRAPSPWPWPVNGWTTSHICRPAADLNPSLNGVARCQALLQLALAECLGDSPNAAKTPVFLASCNAGAHDFDVASWSSAFDSRVLLEATACVNSRAGRLPVFSSSCNSGMHALYAARQILLAGHADEAVVVAVDILSRSNQDNFEALRVLTNSPMRPWQTNSDGFVLGEAAVALKLERATGSDQVQLFGPTLGNELGRDDGMPRVLEKVSVDTPQLLLGQGTGPFANDEAELAAFRKYFAADVPLATSLVHFGHTLGASGLLSTALAALLERSQQQLSTLTMPTQHASDGRPLNVADNSTSPRSVLVSCRALNGSCAAAGVNRGGDASKDSSPENDPRPEKTWHTPAPTSPLMHEVLRRVAIEAPGHRPSVPPDVLLVHLDAPLAPPPQAFIGGRLLPSAVLEITPGFVSQLIARCWGFAGPTLCLVGGNESGGAEIAVGSDHGWDLVAAGNDLGLVVAQVRLRGTGDKREINWHN